MLENYNFLPTLLTSYLLNAFVTYLLATKAGYEKPWVSFIPFGDKHVKVELAGLNPEAFTPASILFSTLSLLFIHLNGNSLIPLPILGLMILLMVPVTYVHWRLLQAFLLPGYLSILFIIPYVGTIVYLIVMLMSGIRTAQFYVGND